MRWLAIGGGVVVALAAVTAVSLLAGSDDDAAGSATTAERRTATVTRRDLVESESFDGTLGYGDATTISAHVSSSGSSTSASSTGASAASGGAGGSAAGSESASTSSSGSGTLTAVGTAGSTIERGGELFRVDEEPTVVLYGSLPMYRDLSTSSSDGPDVTQLEENLAAMGFDPGTVDDEFTSATASAVEDWEDALGREDPDGVVSQSEVVFAPGAVRVAAVGASVGSSVSSGTAILEVTGTAPLVTVDLPVDSQDLVKAGDAVKVELPSGSLVDAVVYSVSSVASVEDTSSSSTGGAAGGAVSSGDPTLDMVVVLGEDADTGSLDEAPVDVLVSRTLATEALSVPVTSLLALAEGGYGLEVVERSGATRLVAVRVGSFADGFVEVSGDGIAEDTLVVMA